jgi:membrane protein implicated in regulation of membrane protease activity
MPDWSIWLIIAGVLAAAEMASLTFVLVMLAGGAAAAALTAAVGGGVLAQCLVAAGVSVALLAGVRPVAKYHLLAGTGVQTGAEALIGQQAVVLTEVSAHDGRVRLNGNEWTARSAGDDVLSAGTLVRVTRISGATAEVMSEAQYFESQQ